MTTNAAQSSATAQRSNSPFKIERFRPRIGAIVSGIRLDQAIDEDTKTRLRAGLLEHGVLFFRDQQFGPQRFLEIAKIFGVPYKQNEYNHGLEGFDEIEVLENSDRRQQRADQWHADVTWQANPPKATILQAQDLPAEGGDTVWSTSAGAYDLLDPKLAAYLETLTAVNSLEVTRLPEYLTGTYGGRYPLEGGKQRLADARAAHPPIEVPVIATHPETGRKVVNVNEGHTSHLKNVSRVAGNSLLTLLFDLIKTPELQARFHWKAGSVAVWDNRQVNHYGVNDYGTEFRKLHRITIRQAAAS
ncbi:MAG: TauD/TfdA family dioxygenase [Pseudomonadota bacterium]